MYKHRFKRMGGGQLYAFLQSFFKEKSCFITWGRAGWKVFFGGGSHSFRQQSLRRTVEHLLPMRGKGNHKWQSLRGGGDQVNFIGTQSKSPTPPLPRRQIITVSLFIETIVHPSMRGLMQAMNFTLVPAKKKEKTNTNHVRQEHYTFLSGLFRISSKQS